jgi:rubrerythrin
VEKIVREEGGPKSLRDYDEKTLEKILELARDAQGHRKQFEEKMQQYYDDLLKRGDNERKKFDRIGYDIKRRHPKMSGWLTQS